MPHRYFTRELADGRAALTGSDAHHLADVMRARLGEEVVLCGPDGLEYLGTVTAIEPGRVEFSVTDGTTSKAEPDCTVTLFAGYPKQGKLEEVIRHSVELGVTGIVPFFSRYCVAAPKKEDAKNERYNRIAAEAAKQKHLVKALLHGQLCRVFRIGIVLDMGQNYDLVVLLLRAGCRVEVAHDHMGLAVQGRTVAVACIAGDDKIIFPQQTGQRRRDRAGRKDHTPCHKQTFLAF